jgi:hypothetical protein
MFARKDLMKRVKRKEKYKEKEWGKCNLRKVITRWKICFYVG